MNTAAPITQEQWKEHRAAAMQSLPETLAGKSLPSVLLGYQGELLSTTSLNQVVLCEKSRRIGATWGIGALAVLTSGAQKKAGGMDTMYIGYNMDMAREFIDACAMWARAFMPAATAVDEFLFQDQDDQSKVDRHIQAYRIRFASGFEIVALSSKPRSLRGRQGFLIFDEAAFHDDLAEMMKAALAFLIWGGRILVISTHDGDTNPFNQLIQEARSGKKPYTVVRITFEDAIKDGLFKRICLVNGDAWTQAKEDQFVTDVRAYYGDDAGEELDVIPAQGTGQYLPRAVVEACMTADAPVVRLECKPDFVDASDTFRESFIREWCELNLKPLLEKLNPRHRHYFGEDFGRTSDLTVIWPIALLPNMTRRTPFTVELRNVPFKAQEQILKYIVDRLPRFTCGALDNKGNGSFLAEAARQKYGALAIEQVELSDRWYLEHMPKMKAHIEDRTFLLPKDDQVLDDFSLLKLIKGVARVPDTRTGAKGAKRHGDGAVAAALAIFATYQDGVPIDFHSSGETREADSLGDFVDGGAGLFGGGDTSGFMGSM